jgi:AcrR family transcriptional regulator
MARRPPRRPASTPRNISGSDKPARERVIAALLALLEDKPFEEIGLPELATTAGLTLAELRAEYSSTLAVLAAWIKETDRAVLAGGDADMAEEPPRERLFDVLMRRLEVLTPSKGAIRSLARSARRHPSLALALNGIAVRSQQWMLAAADLPSSGPRGMMRAQGLAMIFGSVLRTWLNDEDEDLAATMAALDRALGRGEHLAGLLDDMCAIPAALRAAGERLRSRRRAPRRDEGEDEQPAV